MPLKFLQARLQCSAGIAELLKTGAALTDSIKLRGSNIHIGFKENYSADGNK